MSNVSPGDRNGPLGSFVYRKLVALDPLRDAAPAFDEALPTALSPGSAPWLDASAVYDSSSGLNCSIIVVDHARQLVIAYLSGVVDPGQRMRMR